MLSELIYAVLTIFLPAHLTYVALKQSTTQQSLSLWSNYWAYFAVLQLLRYLLPFLSCQPFESILLLLHLWLYSQQYRGAISLSNSVVQQIKSNNLEEHITTLAKNIEVLNVFENASQLDNSNSQAEAKSD